MLDNFYYNVMAKECKEQESVFFSWLTKFLSLT